MKRAVLVVGLLAAFPALANEELAKKHACFACHTLDKKMVGPSYKDVAAKYRADKGAQAKLVKKVKEGGQGVWGTVPMPPENDAPPMTAAGRRSSGRPVRQPRRPRRRPRRRRRRRKPGKRRRPARRPPPRPRSPLPPPPKRARDAPVNVKR